ncbi:DivIVA domain-containing protein [Branchiibius hedensis]|uniref:DivIVA domain-containing protein n=1 Tax=Branchiibius hedensis TaxID=672460 RepID=UPI001FE6585C|nr:DivIVA domain-containing protein [Branchiibius hedensis]
MFVFLIVLLVLVIGLVVAGVVGMYGGHLDPPVRTSPFEELPPTVRPGDVDGLRFDQTLRGYRMGQVDDTLDRLRDALADKDRQLAEQSARIAELTGQRLDSLTDGPGPA